MPLPEPLEPPELDGFLAALLDEEPLAPGLEVPLEPDGLLLAPDELDPLADVPPLDADLPLSPRSHAATPRANAIAAASAVNFMLTSMGLCARNGSK